MCLYWMRSVCACRFCNCRFPSLPICLVVTQRVGSSHPSSPSHPSIVPSLHQCSWKVALHLALFASSSCPPPPQAPVHSWSCPPVVTWSLSLAGCEHHLQCIRGLHFLCRSCLPSQSESSKTKSVIASCSLWWHNALKDVFVNGSWCLLCTGSLVNQIRSFFFYHNRGVLTMHLSFFIKQKMSI